MSHHIYADTSHKSLFADVEYLWKQNIGGYQDAVPLRRVFPQGALVPVYPDSPCQSR